MKSAMLALVILAAPAVVSAQARSEAPVYGGNYYFTGYTGACQHGYMLYGGGGGAEGIFWKGISFGGEASYQVFSDGWGLGYFTVQPGFHFRGRNRSAKFDPFVTFGMGGAMSNQGGIGPSANLGGGFNYWVKDKVALRFDVRLQAAGEEAMTVFGLGVSFR